MQTRRIFLHKATLAAMATAAYPFAHATVPAKLKQFGFIAGIVRKELEQDWQATLRQAVAYGFTELETNRHFGESVPAFVEFCQEVGLTLRAGGVPLKPAEQARQLDQLQAMGIDHAICYWPWLTGGPFTLADCEKSVELLNTLGATCRERGMRFCWHNHDKEFVPMEKGLPFHWLMEHTDPALVHCELDVFWAAKGSTDPLACLKKYPGRYPILHLKDMTNDEAATFACVGSGRIDFPGILREAARQKIRHYFVEQDRVTDGLACLQEAGAYLQKVRF